MKPDGLVPKISGSSWRVREVSSEAGWSGQRKSPDISVPELVITQRESCYNSTYLSYIIVSEYYMFLPS